MECVNPPPQAGAHFLLPRNCHSASHVRQTRGPALGRAPAGGPWGLRARGTSGRQTRKQPRHAPASEPPPHRVHPASVRGPSSRPRLKIATAPDTFARPGAPAWAWRPRAAPGGYELAGPQGARRARNPATPKNCHSASRFHQTRCPTLGTAPARPQPVGFHHRGTSRRQSATSAHARCRAGNGEEQGRTLRARNPATVPIKSTHQPHGVRPASVRAPRSAIAVARCPPIGGRAMPRHPRRPPSHPI